MQELERRFHSDMVAIHATAKRELHYNASRFLQMVSERGGLEAARQLLHVCTVSEGFTTLWERSRLDLSVEAHVLKPEYTELFTEDERLVARQRLDEYGFNFEAPKGG